jgi:hypothetical protein
MKTYASSPGGLRPVSARLLLLAWLALALGSACGEVRPLPPALEPPAYAPITYEQLLDPKGANLAAGQKVKVPAYFWDFLHYDPAIVKNYLTLARHPRTWGKLKWLALYESPKMRGYYDLAALDAKRTGQYKLQRLDHIMVYGELASLGKGLYLRVHHLEKIEED